MANALQELYDRIDAADDDARDKAAVVEASLEGILKEYGPESCEYAAALNELGSCLRAAGDYESAANRFKSAVNLLARTGGPESPEYAMALMNYAGAVRLLGRIDESLALFKHAKEAFSAALGEASMEYLTALNNEALCHQDKGDYEEALIPLVRVCSTLDRHETASVPYATSLYNTGFCFKQIGEEDLGEELVRRSIEVYRQLLPDGHELLERAKAALGEQEAPRP